MKLSSLLSSLSGLLEGKPESAPSKPGTPPAPSQEFAVIGLGRFGITLARTLVQRGYHVLGIDKDVHLVQYHAEELTQTVALDSTDEHALREIDIQSFNTVIVAIGDHLEDSVLATVILKDMGVKNVICKAATNRQRQILLKVGADRVVSPEIDAGLHLAQQLAKPGIVDQLVIGPVERVSQVQVSPTFYGRTLGQADIDRRFHVRVLAAVRDGRAACGPDADFLLREGDFLIVFGHRNDLARLAQA